MAEPSVPGEETRQLQAIHSLRVLDIQPEARFERVTSMAKRLFAAPIAELCLDERARDACKHIDVVERFEAARETGREPDDAIFVVTDAAADPRFSAPPVLRDGRSARFYAGCPVRAPDGSRMGTLCLIDTIERRLSADDLELLGELGRMVNEVFRSLAIATSDSLTKLANRRGFEDIAAHIVPMAIRHEVPLSLIALDLDDFKRINDRHGHETGDRMLVAFARHLLKNFRQSDVVARLGGDEFCVLMSGAEAPEAAGCLERLEACLATAADDSIRFSAGVVSLDRRQHALVGDLLRDADRRMYESKRRKQAATSPVTA